MKHADREHPPGQPPIGDAEVAERFRGAVETSSPTFSGGLHADVMRAVRAQRWQNVAAAPAPRGLRPWHIAALTAAAAAVAIAVAVTLLLAVGRFRDKSVVKRPQPAAHPLMVASRSPFTLPRLTDAAVYVEPVKHRIDQTQRAILSRSADRLQRYCLDQIRIFPSRPRGDGSNEPGGVSPPAG